MRTIACLLLAGLCVAHAHAGKASAGAVPEEVQAVYLDACLERARLALKYRERHPQMVRAEARVAVLLEDYPALASEGVSAPVLSRAYTRLLIGRDRLALRYRELHPAMRAQQAAIEALVTMHGGAPPLDRAVLEAERARLLAEQAALAQRYAEKHPRMVTVRKALAGTEERLETFDEAR